MSVEMGFQELTEMVRRWDEPHKEEFYKHFPDTIEKKVVYQAFGIKQHEDQQFAEGFEIDGEDIDEKRKKCAADELARLASIARREAHSFRDFTVYRHARKLWQKADNTPELLEYLEKYSENKIDWNEVEAGDLYREEDEDKDLGEEYIEETLANLVSETMERI